MTRIKDLTIAFIVGGLVGIAAAFSVTGHPAALLHASEQHAQMWHTLSDVCTAGLAVCEQACRPPSWGREVGPPEPPR